MTFEEWFERYSDKNNYHSKEELKILAKQAWEAAQSEVSKQLEFEKAQTESQRAMKILARNQRDAMTRKNNILMNALEMATTANGCAVKKELDIEWQPIETAPKTFDPVLLLYYENKKPVIVIAHWVAEFSEESTEDFAVYNEETDEYYCPEGWYEQQRFNEEYGYILMDIEPRYWMPLPQSPTDE